MNETLKERMLGWNKNSFIFFLNLKIFFYAYKKREPCANMGCFNSSNSCK